MLLDDPQLTGFTLLEATVSQLAQHLTRLTECA